MTEQPDPKQQPNEFQLMDRKDETQIIEEIEGQTALIEEYVYSFEVFDKKIQRNRTVTGLSYAGIKEMVRKRGNFEIISTEKEETDQTIRVLVKIRDLTNHVDFLGASETKKGIDFAYVLAINKAERNAYRKAMPAEFLAKMIDAFLHGQKTERPLGVSPPQDKPQPPQNPPQPKPAIASHPDQVYAEFPPDLGDYLDFKDMGDHVILKPRMFLGSDVFAAIKDIVLKLNGEYVSQGKESHFRVPLAEAPKA